METILLIGLGLVAAFIGTIVMTIGQEIELRFINKRPISYTPAIAVFTILRLDFERLSGQMKGFMSYLVHFVYGTIFGVLLVIFHYFNLLSFWPAFLIFFLVVWLQGLIVIPLLGIGGPPWSWGLKANITEFIHKLIYAFVSVGVFILIV